MKRYSLIHEDPYPIYLGDHPDDLWYDEFRSLNVVVNLDDRGDANDVPDLVVMQYPMIDMENELYIPEQERFENFLWSVHVFASTGPSYWHCAAGINRSAYALIAYLHLYRGMTIPKAIDLVRRKRSSYCLNNRVFEKNLFSRYHR